MDDQEKMMKEEDKMMDDKKKEPKYLQDDDTVEVACCGEFTYKCSAVFIGIILCVEFLYLLLELWFIFSNDYFDIEYSAFYAFFMLFILVTVIIFLVWFCNMEDKKARKALGPALLVALIGNFIIIAWVIIYICVIYDNDPHKDEDQVIVQKYIASSNRQDDADDDDHRAKNQDLK